MKNGILFIQCKYLKVLAIFIIVIIFGSLFVYKSDAAVLKQEKNKTYYFYVPNGGFSTCEVDIVYRENYTHYASSHTNTFSSRSKWFAAYYTYSTQRPSFGTGAAVIKTSSGAIYLTYTNWVWTASVFPNADVFGYYESVGGFTIIDSYNYTGQVNYTVECSGAYNGTIPDYVIMGLATN